MSGKEIDFLFEDPSVPGQTFALVSIVGPNMKQKCNMYGMKVRGVADSLEKAKAMSQKILKVDNNYDIYTVEVGKFFPLDVDPHSVSDIEYWHQRKNEMIQEAIKEGKNQEEMANRPEHPIAVLQRIQSYTQKLDEMERELDQLRSDLKLSQLKFDNYSDEQKLQAKKEVENGIEQVKQEDSSLNMDSIRSELISSLETNVGTSSSSK